MENNIFLNIYSFVNRIYTTEDIMLNTNIPKGIKDYFYISKGIELDGRYLKYEDDYIEAYVISDSSNQSFKDTILLGNKPIIVIVIPYIIDGKDTSEINKKRVNLIKEIYKYLFKSISLKLNLPTNSSLYRLLDKAPSILTLFSEINTSQFFNIEDIADKRNGITVDILEKAISYNIEDLFVNGGLLNIIK